MTNHAVLAGSVLAGVALWAGVYATLLPKRGPDRSETYSVGVTPDTPATESDIPPPAPRRWADLPRETAKCPASAPVAVAATGVPEIDASLGDLPPRRHRRIRIRAAALTDKPLPQPLTRQQVHAPVRASVRRRLRRIREPIQFSLATRSSS